jgi:outer membrane protein TolC
VRPETLGAWLLLAVAAGGTQAQAQQAPAQKASPPDATAVQPAVRAVSFAQAWALARQHNPRMPAAAAALSRAEASARLARAAWMPSVRAQAVYTHLDDERRLGDRVLANQDSGGAALILSAPLLDVPSWRESGRARDATAVARAQSLDSQRRLARDLGAVFLGVLLERRALEVAERAAATSRTQLEIARARKEAGVGTRLEEVRAARELHANQGRVALGRAALAAAQEALGAVAGGHAPLDAAGALELPPLPSLATALGELAQRPDLAALARQVALAEREVDDGWAEYLPTLGLSAQPFLNRPATPTQPAQGWQAQLALVLPLYDGGARPARHSDRQARLIQIRAALDEARLEAEAEVRAGASSLSHRQDALTEAEASARLADESLVLARTAFQEGAGTQVDLIDAERAARDAATTVAVATHDRDRARLALLIATGRLPFAAER